MVVAARLKTGYMSRIDEFCPFSVVQALAAEGDEWKRDRAIINKPRRPSHVLQNVAKAGLPCFVFPSLVISGGVAIQCQMGVCCNNSVRVWCL